MERERETDRGTESSSSSLTGTSYTIDQLESTSICTLLSLSELVHIIAGNTKRVSQTSITKTQH